MMEEKVINIRDLKKSFGDNHVLQGLNMELKKGENLVVLGKSGVGKSVLIKCIIRLIEADDGEIRVFADDVNQLDDEDKLNQIRRKVGYLFQGGALYDAMDVEGNLKFPLQRSGEKLSEQEYDERVDEVLENVGLAEAKNKMPSELSGGMKKRIALARTLILHPEIMLYDEPTTGLDPVTSGEISELLLEMQEKYNMSSVIITHDMECAKTTSNRVALIKDGVFDEEGSYDELKNSNKEWVRAFFK
ncbi:MAG: ATP-binding cassette domain-containing protein [Fulvivirga sp.]|nr:ATP-binding cassette domain-containing protein [Fulvivirga sp.]